MIEDMPDRVSEDASRIDSRDRPGGGPAKAHQAILVVLALLLGMATQGLERINSGGSSPFAGNPRAYTAANGSSLRTIRGDASIAQAWLSSCLANDDVRIVVLPRVPMEGEPITLRISGVSGDSCVPQYGAHQVQGNLIEVQAWEPSCTTVCTAIVVEWTLNVELGPLPAGSYMVEFRLLCEGVPPPVPPPDVCSATPFTVIPCCDFDRDGQVDGDDVREVAGQWRQSARQPHDTDNNGVITILDIMRVNTRLGSACP